MCGYISTNIHITKCNWAQTMTDKYLEIFRKDSKSRTSKTIPKNCFQYILKHNSIEFTRRGCKTNYWLHMLKMANSIGSYSQERKCNALLRRKKKIQPIPSPDTNQHQPCYNCCHLVSSVVQYRRIHWKSQRECKRKKKLPWSH